MENNELLTQYTIEAYQKLLSELRIDLSQLKDMIAKGADNLRLYMEIDAIDYKIKQNI